MACTSQTVGHLLEAVEGLNHKNHLNSFGHKCVPEDSKFIENAFDFKKVLVSIFQAAKKKHLKKAETNEVLMTKILHIP